MKLIMIKEKREEGKDTKPRKMSEYLQKSQCEESKES